MKRRKAYKPRPASLDPVTVAILRAAVMDEGQRQDMSAPLHQAFANLRAGVMPTAAWADLADCCNVGEVLAEMGIASDRLGEFRAAQQALADIHARNQERGSWTARSSELAFLERAIELHEVQMLYASQGEFKEAIEKVKRRTFQALRGNVPRGRTVLMGALGQA